MTSSYSFALYERQLANSLSDGATISDQSLDGLLGDQAKRIACGFPPVGAPVHSR
jgi:hypothetical protein